MVLELPVHVLGVNLLVDIAFRHTLTCRLERLHLPCTEAGGDEYHKAQNKEQEPDKGVSIYVHVPDHEQEVKKQYGGHYYRRAWDYGYLFRHIPHPAAEALDQTPAPLDGSPAEPAHPAYKRVAPPDASAQLHAGREREERREGEHDVYISAYGHGHDKHHSVPGHKERPCVVDHIIRNRHHRKEQSYSSRPANHCVQVQRQTVCHVQASPFPALSLTGGDEHEHEAGQSSYSPDQYHRQPPAGQIVNEPKYLLCIK